MLKINSWGWYRGTRAATSISHIETGSSECSLLIQLPDSMCEKASKQEDAPSVKGDIDELSGSCWFWAQS